MKLLYYNCLNYTQENLDLLRQHFEIFCLESPLEDNKQILSEISILSAPLGFKCDKNKINLSPKLEIIFSNTTGHPHIDVDYANKRGIKVITLKNDNVFLENITPTAEHTWWMIQSLSRPYDAARKSVHSFNWDRKPYAGKQMLSKKVIGIVGLGRLGKLVANYSLAFGLEVIFYDPNVQDFPPNLNKCNNLKEIFENCDIITIHVPHEQNTENLITKKLLFSSKKSPIFVNTSRAEIVDNEALLEAFKLGYISGIGVDVINNEYESNIKDYLSSSELVRLAKLNKNIIITPHIGGSTIDAWTLTQRRTIEKTINYYQKGIDAKKYMKLIQKNVVWGFIPARGGSKSVPMKNLTKIGGISLLETAINAASSSKEITKIICSTDAIEIIKLCKSKLIDVDKRPKILSGDTISTVEVLVEFFERQISLNNKLPEFVALFEPTSPFVRRIDIEKCIQTLKKNTNADSSQTVTEVPANAHAWNQRYHYNNKSHFLFKKERKSSYNKQSKPKLYMHGNLRVTKISCIIEKKSIFGDESIPILIPNLFSFDADSKEFIEIGNILKPLFDELK